MKKNSPTIIRAAESGNDPDRLAHFLSTSASSVTVEPLDQGKLSFRCDMVSLGPMTLIKAAYEGRMRNTRHAEGDKLLVVLPDEGTANIRGLSEDFASAPGKGVIIDAVHNRGFDIAERRRHLTVAVDRTEMQRRLSVILETSVGDNFAFHPEIDLSNGAGCLLGQLANFIFEGGSNIASLPPSVFANLSDAFFNLALGSLQHSFSDRLHAGGATASPRQVKRAIEFMRAHLHEVLTLEQIVQASGGSTRALQLGFQQFKFTSPMRYLKDLRLEAVHKELLTGDNVRTIAQVAQTWQFFQLGRFAADYHSRFGELPSQTFSKRG
ncbi:AraC family transcriptional regulator [Rhizobium leguminosarum]|uniref:AraC family transcriptional regulator n=2 Tax=Rhizobium leguminosarum TaxID=384 RepID=UPI0003A6DE4A|nr:AraC family transcriptional regulator [Rhizobium leguminosarum]MBY3029372.1 AraC family transcriptional regulator [Rhizobium leguminosarum]MBY3041668.1 AraC family transcriptional regulator [Rhizobium leguminosarum]RWX38430.1 AraC family transcriptional regulator [Rhizobium leguminosarum]